jgi:sec-independent protein translocase protein TatA
MVALLACSLLGEWIMGSIGPLQIIIVAVLLLILFGGRGKISSVMGDVAKGIKSFKSNIKDEEQQADKIEENSTSTVGSGTDSVAATAPVSANDEAAKT